MNPDLKISDLNRAKSIKDETFKKELPNIKKYFDLNIIDLLPKKEFVSEERVTFENNLQIRDSTQFIFSKDDNFKLADKYLNEYPYYADKDRKRMIIN